MKFNIELNVTNEETFLNFWDSNCGQDVICEIIDGQLFLHEYEGDELIETPITLQQFINLVTK